MDINEIFTPKLTIKRAIEIFNRYRDSAELTPKLRPHNKFMYEFLPTIALASKLHAEYLTVIKDINIPCDSLLYFNSSEIMVEWVSAMPHKESKIKLAQIERYGKTSIYERICLDRGLNNPEKPLLKQQTMESAESYCEENLTELITTSFFKKDNKCQNGGYDPDMHLGIFYNDSGLDQRIAFKAIEEAKKICLAKSKSFKEIYFVSLREAFNIVEFHLNQDY